MTDALQPAARLPRQIPFIIGNEGCERFSFYGMRNILTSFLIGTLLLHAPEADRASMAKDVFHSFVIGVFFFPLLGGWLADRYFGKYNTVLWFSLIYCVGHACLAFFEDNRQGFYTGWYLASTFGSLWVLLTNAGVRNEAVTRQITSSGLSETAFLMFFFAGFAFLAALAFTWYARRYPMQDNYRTA
jgi:nitrate/nitrite transporter NarK